MAVNGFWIGTMIKTLHIPKQVTNGIYELNE